MGRESENAMREYSEFTRRQFNNPSPRTQICKNIAVSEHPVKYNQFGRMIAFYLSEPFNQWSYVWVLHDRTELIFSKTSFTASVKLDSRGDPQPMEALKHSIQADGRVTQNALCPLDTIGKHEAKMTLMEEGMWCIPLYERHN